MFTFFVIVHVVVSVLMVLVILLQVSRGATGSSFLSASSDSLFLSPEGDKFLKKIIVILAVVFAITSITLTRMEATRGIKLEAGATQIE